MCCGGYLPEVNSPQKATTISAVAATPTDGRRREDSIFTAGLIQKIKAQLPREKKREETRDAQSWKVWRKTTTPTTKNEEPARRTSMERGRGGTVNTQETARNRSQRHGKDDCWMGVAVAVVRSRREISLGQDRDQLASHRINKYSFAWSNRWLCGENIFQLMHDGLCVKMCAQSRPPSSPPHCTAHPKVYSNFVVWSNVILANIGRKVKKPFANWILIHQSCLDNIWFWMCSNIMCEKLSRVLVM